LKAVSFNDIADKYHTLDFQDALADFIAQINYSQALTMALRVLAEDMLLHFYTIPVFHKIKFVSTSDLEVINTAHVWLDQRDACGCLVPLHFDTVLIWGGPGVGTHGNKGKFKSYECCDL
jgi:hypothetical protein